MIGSYPDERQECNQPARQENTLFFAAAARTISVQYAQHSFQARVRVQ